MDNVLIDDRRIHVDFSQSVSKYKWKGKGRGVDIFDEKGKPINASKSAPWIRNEGGSSRYFGQQRSSNKDDKSSNNNDRGDHRDVNRGGHGSSAATGTAAGKHKWSRSPPRYSRGHASEQARSSDRPYEHFKLYNQL